MGGETCQSDMCVAAPGDAGIGDGNGSNGNNADAGDGGSGGKSGCGCDAGRSSGVVVLWLGVLAIVLRRRR
jgi:MYXO-CTERM domain-containing protein